MVTVHSMITTCVTDHLDYMCGCFGCCTKSTPIIAVGEPSKGLRIRGHIVRKPSISDDFWSSSTYDLENSVLQSQRSFSSISASNPTLSQCSSSGSIVNPSDFVNQGKFVIYYIFFQVHRIYEPRSYCLESGLTPMDWK